jgi:FkbM family methyltransferase
MPLRMILNTRRLFCKLLPLLRVDTICDVGSLDGRDALRFRAAVPDATIYAFEAHPQNLAAMHKNRFLLAGCIETVGLAVTNFDGEADFFAVAPGAFPGDDWRGMSSLHRRTISPARLRIARVDTCRLDSFLRSRTPESARLALWIDAEGRGYEVIEGAEGFLPNVQLLHVEVETNACIASGQSLFADIGGVLHEKGFTELARDRRLGAPQLNVLFIRMPPDRRLQFAIRALITAEAMRAAIAAVLYRLCPRCMRCFSRRRDATH